MKQFLVLYFCTVTPAIGFGQQEAGWHAKTVGQRADQLGDEDERVRWYATYALGQIGPEAAPAVEPLVGILSNRLGHEYVRCGAAWALGRIGAQPETTVALLAETLESQRPSIRRNSAEALGAFGQSARSAIPGLLEALEDEDVTVRVHAAVALWKIGRHPKAVAALTEIIRQGEPPGPGQAAAGLGHVGSQAPAAVPVLVAALGHADQDVRRSAARALGQIGPAAMPVVKPALSDPDEQVRRGAVEALGWIGSEAVSELIAALKNDGPAARRAAARALGRLGPAAASAEPALLEAVADPDARVRAAAHRARREIRSRPDSP